MAAEPDGVIDFGASTSEAQPLSSTDYIDAILVGERWADFDVTYSFTDDAADYDYTNSAPGNLAPSGFFAMSGQQETSATYWLDQFATVSGLSFTELDGASGQLDEDQEATIRFANTTPDYAPTAFAFYPWSSETGGDIWFGTTGTNPTLGNFDSATMGHELGHALGLQHGHEGSAVLPTLTDSLEYSIMTYRSFVGHDLGTYAYNTTETFGAPQSLMMHDIAALQHMYGADFTTNSGDTTYYFSQTTGEMFINGVGVGTPGANRVFRTVWDGHGVDTYDFSNYSTNMIIRLEAGAYSDFDVGGNFQRADLGYYGPGAGVQMARGHLFNALQSNNDLRSLIDNAIGGSGNDILVGNQISNTLSGKSGNDELIGKKGSDVLRGNGGRDVLTGGGAKDRLFGGNGQDILDGGRGNDVLHGGAKSDTFVFTNGRGKDRIVDFTNDVDTLKLDDALWGTSLTAAQVVSQFASVSANKVILNFGGGDSIVLKGFASVGVSDLIDDILIY